MAIDPALFTVERLLATFLDDSSGSHDVWRQTATIIPGYMPLFPRPETRTRCVVRCGGSFLRHSHGPSQGHFWDAYGDDYQTPELAFMALLEAPIPPGLIKPEVWDEARAARQLRETSKGATNVPTPPLPSPPK